MSDQQNSHLSNGEQARRRIAKARAARTPVDNQGTPVAPQSVYEYDEGGRLIATRRPDKR